jgi:uncharacterized membrane protein
MHNTGTMLLIEAEQVAEKEIANGGGAEGSPGAEGLILWLAILAALIAVAVYVILKIRAKTLQNEPRTSEILSKFRDLHSQGELSDEEFRTIKTTLAADLQKELNDSGKTG